MSYNCTECGSYISDDQYKIRFKTKVSFFKTEFFCSAGCKRRFDEHNPKMEKVRKSEQPKQQEPVTAGHIFAQAELERTRHEIQKQEKADRDKENKELFDNAIKYWKIWVPVAAVVAGFITYKVYTTKPSTSNNNAEKEWNTLATSVMQKPAETVQKQDVKQADDNITPEVTETSTESITQTEMQASTGAVIVDEAHFYTEPSEETKRKAYLIKNQEVKLGKTDGDFVFGSYTNEDGKTTEGWMLKSDLKL